MVPLCVDVFIAILSWEYISPTFITERLHIDFGFL